MATYAIGDIHGTLGALKTIFREGGFSSEDTFVFLGDYVDRGPNTCGVLSWLIRNAYYYNFIFLRGNHEIMMLTARTDRDRLQEWLYFGGAAVLESYDITDDANWDKQIDETHWQFLEETRSYYEQGDYIFVHAGLEQSRPLEEQNAHHLFWRKYEIPEPYLDGKTVICGHTSRKNGEIADFGHTICIDTFAHGGMWLSCLNVDTKVYIQARSTGEYKTGKL